MRLRTWRVKLDNYAKEGIKMQTDSEHKYDELSRRLGVLEVRQLFEDMIKSNPEV